MTLEQISGDDKDGIFEYTITIPTTALPDIETRNTLWDQKYAKKWQIRLDIEDNAGHEQAFLLYDWSDVNNGFSITNDKFEHELPQFTYSLDKSSVDVTDESQDLVLTVEWDDQENGADLERLLDGIDENRNGNIQDEQEWSRLYFVKSPDWFYEGSQDDKDARNVSNVHELWPISYEVDNDQTTDNKAVIKFNFTVPVGLVPGEYDLQVPYIYDKADNGGWVRVLKALNVTSDTEDDPPAYELISVSSREIDVTDSDVDLTVTFRIVDETGIEERNLSDQEDATTWFKPGILTTEYDENGLTTWIEKPLCEDTMYLDSESDQAYWYFDEQREYDEGGITFEWILENSFTSDGGDSSSARTDGDHKDGTYQTTITVDRNAYPGLYRLELDRWDLDDEHGNDRRSINEWSCDDDESENCSNIDGDDIFYNYIRVINSNFPDAPEKD